MRGSGWHKPSKSRDQTDLALINRLEGIGAADAARNGTAETDAFTEAVDCSDEERWLESMRPQSKHEAWSSGMD